MIGSALRIERFVSTRADCSDSEKRRVLTIVGPDRGRLCDGISRRDFVRIGALGLGGLSLPELLAASEPAAIERHKAIIMVYLPGGPPQQDLFDLKPQAPSEMRSPFRPIDTNVPGIQVCELLPRLAQIMDKLAVVRSLVGMQNRHESFQCYTGRPGGRAEDDEPGGGWPTLGSVLSRLQGPGPGGAPAYVDAAPKMSYGPYNNSGLHDNTPRTSWPGFLGIRHTPFHIDGEGRQDLVLGGTTPDRFHDRRTLLSAFDDLRRRADADGLPPGLDVFREQAFGILTSAKLGEAIDLEREAPRVRRRYGELTPNSYSHGGAPKSPQHFLLARRLVEAGVRCVTVAFNVWDWHGDPGFGGPLEKLAREDLPVFDQALSALVEDLHERGLAGDVSVVVWGEFGRTPRVNTRGGRDHWPNVAFGVLAGGGMRTGQCIGATDRYAGEAAERPVHVQEVFATLYRNAGIDVNSATVTDLNGRPRYLVDENRQPIRELI